MSDWRGWIGREERSSDVCSAGFAKRWRATFDLERPADGPLPQSVHWCLGVPDTPQARLGEDGHPLRDAESFLPPIPKPRRMWAGSSCEFLAPIAVGSDVSRVSRIEDISEKSGTSGTLAFVTVAHEWRCDDALAVRELQTLVYRDAPDPGSAPPPPREAFDPADWDSTFQYTPDAPLMFRYSALTFNTHRIHYDADYARNVEGYPGLVVHGPLSATQLLLFAQREFGWQALAEFSFRALSPAFAGERIVHALRRHGDALELAAFADPVDGTARKVMQAKARLAA